MHNQIFTLLRSTLKHHEASFKVIADRSDNYCLDWQPKPGDKKERFFAAVHIKKSYVALHLMPVYEHPELLDGMSPELKKRMQGKSCFNFKKLEHVPIDELKELVSRCVETSPRQL